MRSPVTIIYTKFEFDNIDTSIRCRVIAFLLLIRYVTLWPWPLTFWNWTVIMHGGSHDQSSAKFEDPMPNLLELW